MEKQLIDLGQVVKGHLYHTMAPLTSLEVASQASLLSLLFPYSVRLYPPKAAVLTSTLWGFPVWLCVYQKVAFLSQPTLNC